MSSLFPELRADKNGKLVTRHVKGSQPSAITSSIPSPSLPSESKTERSERLTDECLGMLNSLRKDHNWPVMTRSEADFLKYALRDQDGLLEDLHALLPTLDERGLRSVFHGMGSATSAYGQGPGRLALVVKAYPYCRAVDDAIPVGELADRYLNRDNLWDISYEVMSGNMRVQATDENVADLESVYLLNKLELNESSFPTKGDYYRALAKLKDQQDELKPYMPLLLAFGAIVNESAKEPTNWYFNDSWYLWENIGLAKSYPVEHIPAIAAETVRRGDFSEEIAQQIIDNNAASLIDGIL